jgi:hypothetical protein
MIGRLTMALWSQVAKAARKASAVRSMSARVIGVLLKRHW